MKVWFPLLLSLCAVIVVAAQSNEGYPCNTIITNITKEEIIGLATTFLDILVVQLQFAADPTLSPETIASRRATALDEYLGLVQYDVVASKVCGTCADVRAQLEDDNMDGTTNSMIPPVCQEGAYGANTTYSALVFHPLDPSTNLPLNGKLSTLVSFQGTRLATEMAPSTDMPSTSVTNDLIALAAGALPFFPDFYLRYSDTMYPMVAAGMGMIGMVPDKIGTGASYSMDRSYLTKYPTEQSALIAWVAAQRYTHEVTSGCTALDKERVVTVGYSAGGHYVVFGTLALQNVLGLTILQSFAIAPVSSVTFFLQVSYLSYLSQPDTNFLTPSVSGFFAFFLASYSNDVPFLPTSGTNQTIMSPTYANASDLFSWFLDEKLSYDELTATVPLKYGDYIPAVNPLIQPAALSAGLNGSMCLPPYVTDDISVMCTTLEENSPYRYGLEITYPLEICHSPNDDVVPYALGQLMLSATPTAKMYEPVEDFLAPRGGHVDTVSVCAIGLSSYYKANQDLLLTPVPIENDNAGNTCPGVAVTTATPTTVPTTSSVDKGTDTPTEMPSPTGSSDSSVAGVALQNIVWTFFAASVVLLLGTL